MHDCQRFREDWIAGTAEDSDCRQCRRFCDEADAILLAAAGAAPPIPEFSEEYWNGYEDRLRERLIQENASRSSHIYWKWSALAAVAAIALVVTWGAIRPAQPSATRVEIVDGHIRGLDPMVVAFLERSELFLRNFTKIEPSHVEDLNDSRARARQSLTEIRRQKELAGNFAPVGITLDEYENVLREIKNLNSSGELAEVQSRVLASGLIANMKAYQPQVMLVSQR
jgi:hypothetical protein